jgi:hypothetical protein
VLLLSLLCLAGTACSTNGPTGKILFDDPRGTVSLQTISDPSIKASHPISLDSALLAKLLRGIEIQDQERGIQKALVGISSPAPVFSEDQIRFLAPLIAEGLRMAALNQYIAYRVQATYKGSGLESSTTETTAGSLYAYGRQLYVTLSQYRYDPVRVNMNRIGNMNSKTGMTGSRVPDSSGLLNRTVLFTPSDAQRSDTFDPPTKGKPTDRFLAIDYQLLEQASRALATTRQAAPQVGGGAAPVGEALEATRAAEAQAHSTEALAKQVEALRKELESVQKQLGNQPTG